jgi:phenylpropionate dioxygenase-like ring-hydroxylating dioxygenase large terminal subunit
MIKARLAAPPTKEHVSVARMTDYWYVACRSKRLGRRPRAATVLGTPLVLFRGQNGQVGALLDRCPHRNAPLSAGRVVGDRLQCGYHGWEFGCGGVCEKIPGLIEPGEMRGRSATAFPVRDQQGLIWVWMNPERVPTPSPYWLPHLDDARYTQRPPDNRECIVVVAHGQ